MVVRRELRKMVIDVIRVSDKWMAFNKDAMKQRRRFLPIFAGTSGQSSARGAAVGAG